MELEIRDKRNKGWFWLDNEYLNGYARHLGATTTVVYISLCRHANNDTQESWPSMRLIAEENGITTRTVVRAIAKLEKWKIITIKKSKKADGTQQNNLYTLTDKKVWISKPSDIMSHGNRVTIKTQPSDNKDIDRVTPVLHNNTNVTNKTIINNTISNASVAGVDLNNLIKLFEPINPSYERLFSNTTQRACLERLSKKYEYKVLVAIIKAAEWASTQKYAPVITTPLQLETKMGELSAFIKKNSNKSNVLIV